MSLTGVMACVLAVRLSAAEKSPWHEAIESALSATYRAHPVRSAGDDFARRERAGREFDDALRAAFQRIQPEEWAAVVSRESESIRDKLAALAVDRERRHEIYDEIDKIYVTPAADAPQPRVLQTPLLRPQHAVETYRLAWEFYLLKPDSMAMDRAAEALGQIGNPASVITLRHAAQTGLGPLVLGALANLPSPAGAEATLHVLSAAEGRWGVAPKPYGDWVTLFVEMVVRVPSARRAAWSDVMDEGGSSGALGERLARALRARDGIERALQATLVTRPRLEARPEGVAAPARLEQAAAELDAALSLVAAHVTTVEAAVALANEAESIEAKLKAIAVDRKQRPQNYDELFRTYVAHSPAPLAATRKHLTEPFRLAWELVILAPNGGGSGADEARRAARALATIGNPASSVTLLHVFRLSSDTKLPVTESLDAVQRHLLDAFVELPNRQVAKDIATALRWARAYRIGHEPRGVDWDPIAHVVTAIARMAAPKRDAWRAIVHAVPPDSPEGPALEPFAGELRARFDAAQKPPKH
jgi:hypothetical protein